MNLRLLIGMYAALLLGPVVVVMGLVDYIHAKRLLSEGRIIPGTVADTNTVSGMRGATTYHLIVTYKPTEDGPRYRKDFSVPRSIYGSASVGSEVPVRVSPSDPKVSMIGDTPDADTEKVAIGGGVFLLGIALFWWRRRKLQKIQMSAAVARRRSS